LLADDEGVELGVVVLDVEVCDPSDEFVVEGEDDVGFEEAVIVAAVNFTDAEELVALRIFVFDALDPFCTVSVCVEIGWWFSTSLPSETPIILA